MSEEVVPGKPGMLHIVILDENQNVQGMMEADQFLFVLWNDDQVSVHQSDPDNPNRMEAGVRIMATAMKNSNSKLTALLGAIAERAMEQGLEQFMKNLPPEVEHS